MRYFGNVFSLFLILSRFQRGEGSYTTYPRLLENNQISVGSWDQIGEDIDGDALGDNFGWRVSLSSDGSTVAISAIYYDEIGFNLGHVKIYKLDDTTWGQIGDDISGEAANDNTGYSISLSSDGSRVAIGAPYNDQNGNNSGHVRVYKQDGDAWQQIGSDIDGEAAGDNSGISVSLSPDGSRVAIGAYLNDENGSISGHVRVFALTNSNVWEKLGSDIDGEAAFDYSGRSVSLSSDGSRVAIGASSNDGNGGNSGHVRVFEWDGTIWDQMGSDIDGEAEGNASGYSVSLSSDGSRVAIGAPYTDGYSGQVRVFEWDGTNWDKMGSDIDGEAANDQSGYSVSLSSDGSRVAIGAPYNDGNGNESGHVRVFDWDGTNWDQVGSDIDGEAGVVSGWSVSLSSDGSAVAIGAPWDNAGHVRVFKFNNPTSPPTDSPSDAPIPAFNDFEITPKDAFVLGFDVSNNSNEIDLSFSVGSKLAAASVACTIYERTEGAQNQCDLDNEISDTIEKKDLVIESTDITLPLDLKLSKLPELDDNIYQFNEATKKGTLKFCGRCVTSSDGFEVGYAETVLSVDINQEQDVPVITIANVKETDATVEDELTTNVNYSVDAYLCTESNQRNSDDALTNYPQGSYLEFCIKVTSDDVTCAWVEEASITSNTTNAATMNAVENGQIKYPVLTIGTDKPTYDTDGGPSQGICFIKTQFPASIVPKTGESTMTVTGKAVLEFRDDSSLDGRRFLRVDLSHLIDDEKRDLEENSDETVADYTITAQLTASDGPSVFWSKATYILLAAGSIVLLV